MEVKVIWRRILIFKFRVTGYILFNNTIHNLRLSDKTKVNTITNNTSLLKKFFMIILTESKNIRMSKYINIP